MGRQADDGSFSDFIKKVTDAEIRVQNEGTGPSSELHVHVTMSDMSASFGWTGPMEFTPANLPTFYPSLRHTQRYDSPYVQASFPMLSAAITLWNSALYVDFDKVNRTVIDDV